MLHISRLHHIRLCVRNLAESLQFARHFGFVDAQRDDSGLYLRGAGADTYQVVLEGGREPRLLAIGFVVASAADLDVAIRDHGATPVVALKGPGGGRAVSLTDPEGRTVLLIADIEQRRPDALRAPLVINHGDTRERLGAGQQTRELGPAQLLRIGHVGLGVVNYPACHQFYTQVLGLLPSDLMYAGAPENLACGFYRVDRGSAYVDHHSIVLFGSDVSSLHHMSFEVQDAESQFIAHRWMLKNGQQPIWGVGRHPLGSHVFDLWRDPNGFRFETFTDTDMLTADKPPGLHSILSAEMDLWSNDTHDRYFA
jgi:catechol 2,3-dioxygenase-like lactoylglutathione lyase family enzyme